MTVTIKPYSKEFLRLFEEESSRLRLLLGDDVSIEHVGSSAVGIGGKNIIDILVGVKNWEEMEQVRDKLASSGYTEGHDSHDDRIFMASFDGETGEGDYHVHICPKTAGSYRDFIILRDYLRRHPKKASEYFEKKKKFAELADFDRKKYKSLKSEYVSGLLREAKNKLP